MHLSAIKNEPLTQLDLILYKNNCSRPGFKWGAAFISIVWHQLLRQNRLLFQSHSAVKNLIALIENSAAQTLKPQTLSRPLLSGDWAAIDARIVFSRTPVRPIGTDSAELVPYFRNLIQILKRKSKNVYLVFPDSETLPIAAETGIIPIHVRDLIDLTNSSGETKGNLIFLSRKPLKFLFGLNPSRFNPTVFNDPVQLRTLRNALPISEPFQKSLETVINNSLLDGFKTVTSETIRGFFLAGPLIFFLMKKLSRVAEAEPNSRFIFCGNLALPVLNLFSKVVDPTRGHLSLESDSNPIPEVDARSVIRRIQLGKVNRNTLAANFDRTHSDLESVYYRFGETYERIMLHAQYNSPNGYANFLDGMSLFVTGVWAETGINGGAPAESDEMILLNEINEYAKRIGERSQ